MLQSITYSEYVSIALVIQHAKRIRRIIRVLSSVACLAVTSFSTFRKKVTDYNMRVLQNFSFLEEMSDTLP
jgi:hypothetical protein